MRKRRKDFWLPPDDGLIPVPMADVVNGRIVNRRIELRSPDAVQAGCRANMGNFDELPVGERWGGNYFGSEWLNRPLYRDEIERRRPLPETDPTERKYRRMHDAKGKQGRTGRKQAKARVPPKPRSRVRDAEQSGVDARQQADREGQAKG